MTPNHNTLMTTQPDMQKVIRAVKRYGAKMPRINIQPKQYEPRKTPEDIALRKQVSVIRKGCTGFSHPHFHQ